MIETVEDQFNNLTNSCLKKLTIASRMRRSSNNRAPLQTPYWSIEWFRINLPRSANAVAREDFKAGLASLHVRGCGRPKFHDTKDAGRSLLVRDQVRGVREQRLDGTRTWHGAPVRDIQRPGLRTRCPVREREGASTSLAKISAATQQTTPDDILEQKVSISFSFWSVQKTRDEIRTHILRNLGARLKTRASMISRRNICFYSHVDPHLSNYCLAVTSGSQLHPSTLCAAQNVLKVHPHSASRTASKEHHHRGIPEGLHCVRQTKLTLHRMRYDTTYNFTLYVVGISLNQAKSNRSFEIARSEAKYREKYFFSFPSDFHARVKNYRINIIKIKISSIIFS